jgi:hypothetical protein
MRDLVGLPEFLHKKGIEKKLIDAFPGRYRTQYERVTFSNDNYLDALNAGEKNDQFLNYIVANQMESKLDDHEFMSNLIHEWFEA